jgi:hypothetical protein
LKNGLRGIIRALVFVSATYGKLYCNKNPKQTYYFKVLHDMSEIYEWLNWPKRRPRPDEGYGMKGKLCNFPVKTSFTAIKDEGYGMKGRRIWDEKLLF